MQVDLLKMNPALVLWCDQHLFVLNKPPLLHSVLLPRQYANPPWPASMATMLLTEDAACAGVSPHPGDGGLVQRLDFETSGVILGARSAMAWSRVHELLKSGQLEKSYLVLLEGRLESTRAVSAPLGSPRRRAKKVRVYESRTRKGDRAQPASTHFQPLAWIESQNATLVRAAAPTARRHQVRAHAAAMGHPLLGDRLYGSTRPLASSPEPSPQYPAPPFLLHAEQISFRHPFGGAFVEVFAPLPHWITTTEVLRHARADAGSVKRSTSGD